MEKVSKDIEELNNTINQLDLIDIYRTSHPTTTEFSFFSSALGIFKLDKIKPYSGLKMNVHEVKRNHTEYVSLTHTQTELEMNNRYLENDQVFGN